MRECTAGACSAQAAGHPVGWRGTSPRKASAKGNICNHDSKAKWYLKMGEKKYQERRQNTVVAPRTEE